MRFVRFHRPDRDLSGISAHTGYGGSHGAPFCPCGSQCLRGYQYPTSTDGSKSRSCIHAADSCRKLRGAFHVEGTRNHPTNHDNTIAECESHTECADGAPRGLNSGGLNRRCVQNVNEIWVLSFLERGRHHDRVARCECATDRLEALYISSQTKRPRDSAASQARCCAKAKHRHDLGECQSSRILC